nr:serine/arginine repetitive matrix protein 1-like [Aegilops tauschii subsp. strangulata]
MSAASTSPGPIRALHVTPPPLSSNRRAPPRLLSPPTRAAARGARSRPAEPIQRRPEPSLAVAFALPRLAPAPSARSPTPAAERFRPCPAASARRRPVLPRRTPPPRISGAVPAPPRRPRASSPAPPSSPEFTGRIRWIGTRSTGISSKRRTSSWIPSSRTPPSRVDFRGG